jgi:hypothetical protein
MKKRIIIVTLSLALLTWLFSQLQTEWQHMHAQINDLQTQVVRLNGVILSVREHNAVQDKLIEEAVMAVHRTNAVVTPAIQQATVNTPQISIPPVTPIPFYIGAIEAIKNFILR